MQQTRLAKSRHQGFSLIELMVGMVLALIAVIVVMQIFQQSERSKRTTTSGDAASMDGAIGITDLRRDLAQAGMSSTTMNTIGCDMTLRAGVTLTNLGPVVINHTSVAAGDANTDTLLITYGNGASSPEGDRVSNHPSSTLFNVATPAAFTVGNYVAAATQIRPTTCAVSLDKVTAIAGVIPNSAVTTQNGTALAADTLYDWGPGPRVIAYRVFGGRLQQCDYMTQDCSTTTAGVWTDLIDGVVSLRAMYGRDTSGVLNAVIDTYDQTTPTSNCGWARTEAIKLALTLRNNQLEANAVTGAGSAPVPTWSGAASAPITVSGTANWDHYRYKVFENVVPLRNVVWLSNMLTTQTIPSCNGVIQ